MELCEKIGLKSCAMTEREDYLYCSDFQSNGLFRYNFKDRRIDILGTFDTRFMWNSYWQAVSYGKEIWFIPFKQEERIAVYNIENNSIEYVELPKSTRDCMYRPFNDCYLVGENLYITPMCYDCMLKIKLSTRKVSRIDIGIKEYAGQNSGILYGSCIDNGKIYLCPWSSTKILCFDTHTDIVKTISADIDVKMYAGIIIHNNSALLFPVKLERGILDVDINTGERKVYNISNIQDVKDIRYTALARIKGKIYLFPEEANNVAIVDIVDMSLDKLLKIEYNGEKNLGWFSTRHTSYGEIVIPSDISTPMLLLNEEGIHQLSLRPEKDYFMKVLRSQMGLD